jgi:hypothetical protein
VCKIEDANYRDKVSQPLDKQHDFYKQLLQLTQNNVCKIEDADYFQVSQPLDQQHDSYKRFLQFIQEALDADELRLQQFNTKFNLKDSQGLDDQSTSIGPLNVVQKPHLPRYVNWTSYQKHWSIEWS